MDNDFCSPVLTSELDTDPQLLSIIKGTSGQKPVICFFIRLQTYLRMQFKYRSAERFLNFDASALEHRVVSEQVAVLDEFINHPTLVFANDMDNVKLHFKTTLTTGFSYLSENRQEILLGMHQKFLDRVAIYPQLRVFADIFKQTIDEVETSNNESTKTTLNRLAATLHFHYPAPLSPSKFSNGIANREKQEKLRLRLKRLGREKADEGSIESQSRPSKRACNKN